jgi:hypothetical protein
MATRFSRYEEIKNRLDFDPACHISPETLDHLVGPYTFGREEPERPCQVWKTRKAKRCEHDHRNGWLGRNKDGKEALIGKDCAADEFHADERFHRETKRVNAALEFDDQCRRYTEYRSQLEGLVTNLENARARLRQCQKAQGNVARLLTDRSQRRLDGMRTGNTDVVIEVRRTVIEKEKGKPDKERVLWEGQRLGSLQGTRFTMQQDAAEIGRGLEAVGQALRELNDYHEPRNVKISPTLKALGKFKNHLDSLIKIEGLTAEFLKESNLRLLCYLSSVEDVAAREGAAQLVLIVRTEGVDSLKKAGWHRDSWGGECKRLVEAMDDEIRSTIAPEGFRIP